MSRNWRPVTIFVSLWRCGKCLVLPVTIYFAAAALAHSRNRLSDSWLQIGWKWQGLGLALRDSRPCGWMPPPLRYAVAAALSAVGAKPLRTRRARGYRERCFPEVPAINRRLRTGGH